MKTTVFQSCSIKEERFSVNSTKKLIQLCKVKKKDYIIKKKIKITELVQNLVRIVLLKVLNIFPLEKALGCVVDL